MDVRGIAPTYTNLGRLNRETERLSDPPEDSSALIPGEGKEPEIPEETPVRAARRIELPTSLSTDQAYSKAKEVCDFIRSDSNRWGRFHLHDVSDVRLIYPRYV